MMSGDVCLKVTLVGVPDPRTVSVELFHHGHGDNRQGGVHVGVLRINQHSDLVCTGLNETAQLNIAHCFIDIQYAFFTHASNPAP